MISLMRLVGPFAILVLLFAIGACVYTMPTATRDERAVLEVVIRALSVLPQPVTCLPIQTERDSFSSGTYGFAEGIGQAAHRPERLWLDRTAERARGRHVNLYLDTGANKRPNVVKLAINTLTGCTSPIRLSTPIFSGEFAFVSARPIEGGGRARSFALQRRDNRWVVIEQLNWSTGPVF